MRVSSRICNSGYGGWCKQKTERFPNGGRLKVIPGRGVVSDELPW